MLSTTLDELAFYEPKHNRICSCHFNLTIRQFIASQRHSEKPNSTFRDSQYRLSTIRYDNETVVITLRLKQAKIKQNHLKIKIYMISYKK